MSCYIIGAGAALPDRIVSNEEVARLLGVTPDWIEANSGIRSRRWVAPEQSASSLAVAALGDALNDADMSADRIDYLIGGTLSPDYQIPGIAPLVQHKLAGCRNIPAVDLRVGCAAILYSLQLACGLIVSQAAKTVVCFGAEAQSKGLELSPRSAELSMLFGDGAGALVVAREPNPKGRGSELALRIEDILIESDGRFAEDLIVRSPGTANGARWFDPTNNGLGLLYGSMNGRNVILQAVRKLEGAANEIAARNNVSLDEIDLVIPHQANGNLLRTLATRLSLSEERVVTNVDRYGNTSGASAFIALWQANRERRLRPGALVLILAFGAGFTWGAALCRVVSAA